MNISPKSRIVLESDLPYIEAIDRLKDNIDNVGFLGAIGSSKVFAGHLDGNKFKVIRTTMHGSVKPVFDGVVLEENGLIKVKVEIYLIKISKIAFFTFLAIISLALTISIINSNSTSILSLSITLIVYLIFIKVLFRLGYDQDYYFGISELKEVFKCKK